MQLLHLFDSSAGWEQRVSLEQVLAGLPAADWRQSIATIDKSVGESLITQEREMALLPRRLGFAAMAGPAVRSYCEREAVDLIHAWGLDAATAARAAFPTEKPVVLTLFDSRMSDRQVKNLRTIAADGGLGVACSAERVRRRAVERGVSFDQCVVLRPGVDFAGLAAAGRTPMRERLGIPNNGMLALTPEPRTRDDGFFAAAWSVMMRWYLDKDVRIIVPGRSPQVNALRRLAAASECPQVVVFTGDEHPFEDLCSCADYLVIGTTGETSTTPIAWAMAAATTVIAPATYATAELLSNDLNGLLFKAPECWRRRGAMICAMYDRTENLPKTREVARGQAYEVFSLRRTVRQQLQLYENLLASRSPATGITDPALITV